LIKNNNIKKMMGLFNRFKKRDLTASFGKWLDSILAGVEELPVAWNFNLYELSCVELVATKSFHKKDEDWACDGIFSSREQYPDFQLSEKQWEKALQKTVSLVESYLENGNYKSKLLDSYGVGCGFVDGNLTLVYVNPDKKFRQKKKKITMERINELPLSQLYAWIVVYVGYENIKKTDFAEKFDDFQFNGLQPNKMELEEMRKILFDFMTRRTKKTFST
jgi:hypothetical protein